MAFLALHTTATKNVPSIGEEGLKCIKYPDHPIANDFECPTFFYPLDGIDQELKFLPQNARMRGEDFDDTSYIVMDVPNCMVGDQGYEGESEKYLKSSMTLKKYTDEFMRSKFKEEPEIVCENTTSKDLILGSLLFTELNVIHEKCKITGNVTKCMETEIKQHLLNNSNNSS